MPHGLVLGLSTPLRRVIARLRANARPVDSRWRKNSIQPSSFVNTADVFVRRVSFPQVEAIRRFALKSRHIG